MPWTKTDLPASLPEWIKKRGGPALDMWLTVANSALTHYQANPEQVPKGMTAEGLAIATADKACAKKYQTQKASSRYLEPVEIRFGERATAPVTSVIQVARSGKWQHPRYKEIEIDDAVLNRFVDNHSRRVTRVEMVVDVEHPDSESPDRMGAAGWAKRLFRAHNEGTLDAPSFVEGPDGDCLCADVAWTPYGVSLVRDQNFRYASLEWKPEYEEAETGQTIQDVITAITLTNKPFIKAMAAHNLSDWLPRWGVEGDEAAYVLSALAAESERLWEGREADVAQEKDARQVGLGDHTNRSTKMTMTAGELAQWVTGVDDPALLGRLEDLKEGRLKLAAEESKDMTLEQIQAVVNQTVQAAMAQVDEKIDAKIGAVKTMSEETRTKILKDQGERNINWALNEGYLLPADLTEDSKVNFSDLAVKDPDGFVNLMEQIGKRSPARGEMGFAGGEEIDEEVTPTPDNLMQIKLSDAQEKAFRDDGKDPGNEEHRAKYMLSESDYRTWREQHPIKARD